VFGQHGLFVFVVDGSILPDAPGVPPSMTIAALAERIAQLA
jgi:cholesterol oxidase